MDPLLIGAKLLGAAWPLGARAKQFHDAHRAIGRVLHEALARAVCPDDPEDPRAQAAAELLEKRLRATPVPVPRRQERKWLAQRAENARARLRARRAPKVALFGESQFYELLARWFSEATGDEQLELGEIPCRDFTVHAEPTADVLCIYFVATFSQVLHEGQGGEWGTSLLQSLRAAEENRAWQTTHLSWIGVVLGSSAIGGAAAAGAQLAGASDVQSVIAALGAMGIAVPTQLMQTWARRPPVARRDPLRTDLDEAVNTWLEDCGHELLAQRGLIPQAAEWIAELRHADSALCVSDSMLDHLQRLAHQARAGAQPDLELALRRTENALARNRYRDDARDSALCALERLASAMQSRNP